MSEGYLSHALIQKSREKGSKRETTNSLISQKQACLTKRIKFSIEYQKISQSQSDGKPKIFSHATDLTKSFKKNSFYNRKVYQKHNKFSSFLEVLPKNQQKHRFTFMQQQKTKSQIQFTNKRQSLKDFSPLWNFSFLQKIEKRKKSKDQKCKIVKNFGLNIKTMEIAEDLEKQAKKKKKNEFKNKNLTIGAQNLQVQNQKIAGSQTDSLPINELNKKTMPKKNAVSLSETCQSMKKENNDWKLKRMLQSSNQLLKTFGCSKVQVFRQKEPKFKFYVGGGNNKNLIVSTFRKRSWWSETSDLQAANFVWTQIKHQATLQKMQLCSYYNHKVDKSQHNSSLLLQGQQTVEQQSKIEENAKPFKTPQIGHNHISKGYLLGNKKTLFQNLKLYFQFKSQNLLQIIPLTFFVCQINSQRFQQFQKLALQDKDAIWIVKPGQNSNRGRGIFVSNSIEQIKEKMQKRKCNAKRTYIIQKYLTNIFLYQKRKFDIRTYMLLLSIQGVTKFFWYKQGYIRTSSQIFDLKNLKNEFIHLTNDAIQIKNSNYGEHQNGNKLSYNQFQLYLDHNYRQKGYSIISLHQQMKKMAQQTVVSTFYKLDSRNYVFQLFGLDFIVDVNFKPWLIEINTNPCLQLTSPVLERIIPSLLQNVFRLGIDPIFQPTANHSREKHSHLYPSCLLNNKFDVIFDSIIDFDAKWMEKSRSNQQSFTNEEKVVCQSNQKF